MPRPRLRIAAVFIGAFLLAFGLQSDLAAGLALELVDGSRVRVGQVTAVDDTSVTVAAVAAGIRVERTVGWDRVVRGKLDGESYSRAELWAAFGVSNGEWGIGNGESKAVALEVVPTEFVPFTPLADPLPCCPSPFPIPDSRFPTPGRVIGVRPDSLAAYADLIPAIYPNGVPSTEAAFALALLRERRWLEAIGPFAAPGPWGGPGLAPLGPVPVPADEVPLPTLGGLSQIETRVTSLRAGGGVDVNALRVELVGLDLAGNVVPVEGTAQAFLYAGKQDFVRAFGDVYVPRHEGVVRLAEWTRAVEPGEGFVLPLPEPLPEHDPGLSPTGTLRVRVSVPGGGVFETIAEPVALRPASPLRDTVEAAAGFRFLPDERTTGRRSQAWPHRRDFSVID